MHLLDVTANIYCAFSAVDVLTILSCALSYLSLCGCVHQLILHLNIDKSAENTTRLEDACKGTRDHGNEKVQTGRQCPMNPFYHCLCSNVPSRFYVYLYL